jgi:hypothetical protein
MSEEGDARYQLLRRTNVAFKNEVMRKSAICGAVGKFSYGMQV